MAVAISKSENRTRVQDQLSHCVSNNCNERRKKQLNQILGVDLAKEVLQLALVVKERQSVDSNSCIHFNQGSYVLVYLSLKTFIICNFKVC